MSDSATVAPRPIGQRRAPGTHTLKLLAIPIVGLIVLSNVGDALAPRLVDTHPLQLLAMNARNRNLILVTNSLDATSYYVVGTLRLLVSDPLFFLVGYWYGDTALAWMEARTRSFGTLIRQMEGWFGNAAYPLLFIAPNQYICLFAGAADMSVGGFFTVNIAGTLARLYLIRRLGERFQAPIDDVLRFIRDYRTPLFIASVVIFGALLVSELRRGKDELDTLTDTLDDAADDSPSDA